MSSAGGVGGALARGLTSGWSMGMDQSRFEESKRRTAFEEDRQTQADRRAQQREDRLNTEHQWDRDLKGTQLAGQIADQELKDVVGRAQAFRAANPEAELPADLAAEYSGARQNVGSYRQKMKDLLSMTQTGRVDPVRDKDVSPADFAGMVQVNTGYHDQELRALPAATENLRSGMATGNMGLALQGANVVLGPYLRRGIGEESPYGGTIVRKQIVNAVPARDANGVEHPDKVFPVVRVFVRDETRPGGEAYYDAPLTRNGTASPDDAPVPISLDRLTDFMGNAGTLGAILQHPEAAAKFAQGRKDAGAEIDKALAELNALAPKPKPKIVGTSGGTGIYAISPDGTTVKTLVEPNHKPTGVETRLGEIDDDLQAGRITPERAQSMREDVILGLRGRKAEPGAYPAKKGGTGAAAPAGASKPGGISQKYDSDSNYAQIVDFWAERNAAGGGLPTGLSRADKGMLRDIVARTPAFSGGAREQMGNEAEFGGIKAGNRTAGTRAANFGLAKAEAYEMADLVTEASAAVGRTKFIPINRAILAAEKNTGDPAVVQFGAAINSFINAYARAVSPVGTPTVSDKNHAREMLEAAQSHEQVQATIAQLKREMKAAGNAPKAVRQELRDAANGIGRPSGTGMSGTPAGGLSFGSEQDAMAAVKAGRVRNGDTVTISGRKMIWRD